MMHAVWIGALLLAQARPHGGGGGGVGHHGGGGRGGHYGRTVYVPVYGGTGDYYGDPFYAPQEQAPPPQEPQAVLLNPNFQPQASNPVLYDYSNTPLLESPPLEQRLSAPPPAMIQQADPEPTIYLIALKDGNILAALGFWIDGDTLNYISRDKTRNRISIDRVDREFSIRLNAERHLEFKFE